MREAAAANRLAGVRVAKACLVLAFAVSTWGFWYRLDDDPPYLDFDSATLGIFVNNLTFHDDYAWGFRDAEAHRRRYAAGLPLPHAIDSQHRYRADWAAEFLPASTVLSALQRLFGIPPDGVGDLLEAVSLVFAALGLACVGVAVCRSGRAPIGDALFTIGLTASLPPFLLYVRTTQPHFLYSFLMFWAAMALADRYVESRSRRALYALAIVVALYTLVPYVPLVVLPFAGFLLTAMRRRVRTVVGDPHLYASIVVAAGLFVSLQYTVAVTRADSWSDWRTSVTRFFSVRLEPQSRRASIEEASLGAKLAKLVHQHFDFQRDRLGDSTRDDELWTLPQHHVVWLGLVPVGLLGAWSAWRRRDRAAAVFAAVIVPTYASALTLGLPEGRYVLTAVPALAYFVLSGMRVIAGARAVLLPALLAASLVATTGLSFALVRGAYEADMTERWREMAGLREALSVMRQRSDAGFARSKDVFLSCPVISYQAWLYLQMLGNMRVVSAWQASAPPERTGEDAGSALFALVDESNFVGIGRRTDEGYRDVAAIVDGPSGRRFRLFELSP